MGKQAIAGDPEIVAVALPKRMDGRSRELPCAGSFQMEL